MARRNHDDFEVYPNSAFCCDGIAVHGWYPCEEPERPIDGFALFSDGCDGCDRAWEIHRLPRPFPPDDPHKLWHDELVVT